ncbi:hypothetical protein ACLOJK_009448 [Asimina triloba]
MGPSGLPGPNWGRLVCLARIGPAWTATSSSPLSVTLSLSHSSFLPGLVSPSSHALDSFYSHGGDRLAIYHVNRLQWRTGGHVVDLNGRARLCEAVGLAVDGWTTSNIPTAWRRWLHPPRLCSPPALPPAVVARLTAMLTLPRRPLHGAVAAVPPHLAAAGCCCCHLPHVAATRRWLAVAAPPPSASVGDEGEGELSSIAPDFAADHRLQLVAEIDGRMASMKKTMAASIKISFFFEFGLLQLATKIGSCRFLRRIREGCRSELEMMMLGRRWGRCSHCCLAVPRRASPPIAMPHRLPAVDVLDCSDSPLVALHGDDRMAAMAAVIGEEDGSDGAPYFGAPVVHDVLVYLQ